MSAELKEDVDALYETCSNLLQVTKILFELTKEQDLKIEVLKRRIGLLEQGRATQGTEILRLQIKMDALEDD